MAINGTALRCAYLLLSRFCGVVFIGAVPVNYRYIIFQTARPMLKTGI